MAFYEKVEQISVWYRLGKILKKEEMEYDFDVWRIGTTQSKKRKTI